MMKFDYMLPTSYDDREDDDLDDKRNTFLCGNEILLKVHKRSYFVYVKRGE